MKRKLSMLILLGLLLISSTVLAQEQTYTYSGFDRFIDNVKLFFSNDENKVKLALQIREREITSALNYDNVSPLKNMERARKKLMIVQENVSANMAGEVKSNVDNLINKMNEHENLPENFKAYILEERKTGLTAELVTESEGKEGQTLKREIAKDETTGQNKVEIVVDLDGGEQKIVELKREIDQIENEIAERTVLKTQGEGEETVDSRKVINTSKDAGDKGDGAKIEVKTHTSGDGTEETDKAHNDDVKNESDSKGKNTIDP